MESRRIIVSDEHVKPSSPTPRHLRTYAFSMLDQIMGRGLASFIVYFPPPDGREFPATTQQLKRSLSVILTRFYPFAGRITDDGSSINCNDDGVRFRVAEFPGHRLSDVLENRGVDFCRHLLPADQFTWHAEKDPESRVLLIQVNHFDCGGIAIGIVSCHKVADAASMVYFLKAWAGANRGSKEGLCPNYISQVLFPYKEGLLINEPVSVAAHQKRGKSSMRRYVFDNSAISSLQARSAGAVEKPSRVEAVSAFLWKCLMAVSLENGKQDSFVIQPVNLRRRAQPPLPLDCFGNFVNHSVASSNITGDGGADYGVLVKKLRDAMRKIDGDYVAGMQGDDGLLGYLPSLRNIPVGANCLFITSWCGLGIYSVDFGWGKPVWTTLGPSDGDNSEMSLYLESAWLVDTRNGDGIEMWVVLGEKYALAFDAIEELRELACIDPSPIGH